MIIILDEYSPFFDNKSFLSDELIEMIRYGERIIVYSFLPPKHSNSIGDGVPENVDLRSAAYEKNPVWIRVFLLIKSLLGQQFFSDLMLIVKEGLSLKRIKAAFLYSYIVENIYFRVNHDIKKNVKLGSDDKIIIYSFWMHLHACVGSRLKKTFKDSVFVTRAHGYDLYEERSEILFLPARRMIFDTVDAIYPVSQQGVDYLLDRYSFKNTSIIKKAYLGTFDYGRNIYNKKIKRIVSCSRIIPLKRLDLLIKALALIKDEDIEWVHYGDGEYREKVEKFAEISLGQNIHYKFLGEIENSILMQEYQKESVSYLINVSETEGLPVSIMESMSFGIPVIATDVGGVSEIVINNVNGFLIDKNISAQELSNEIIRALGMNEEEYKKLRRNARKKWEECFDAKKNYAKFFQEIHEI